MRLLTAKEIATAWQIPVARVYELVRLSLIPCVRLGRQIRFEEATLRDWIARGGVALTSNDQPRGLQEGGKQNAL